MTDFPDDLARGTLSTAANPTNWNALVDNINDLKDYLREYASHDVKAYGAEGDGVADDHDNFEDAITAAAASGGFVVVPEGTYKLSDDVTVAGDVTLVILQGAQISVDSGKTLTINDPAGAQDHSRLEAGQYKIFTGSGSVILGTGSCDAILAEWFGAIADDSTNNDTAIEDAIAAAEHVKVIEFGGGVYCFSSPIDSWPYDYPASMTGGMLITGAGKNSTTLKYTGTSDFAIKLDNPLLESDASARSHSRIIFRDLYVTAPNITGAEGGAFLLAGTSLCRIENVHIGDVGDGTHGTGIKARRRHYVLEEDSYNAGYDTKRDFTTSGAGASEKHAIKFTTAAYQGGVFGSVTVRLGKTGSPGGTITASIFDDNAGEPGTLIGTASTAINASSLSADPGTDITITFPWDSDRDSTATTVHWIVIETSGYTYTDGVTEIWINVDAGGGAANSFATYDYSGSSWSTAADGTDYIVKTGETHVWLNALEGVQMYGTQKTAQAIDIDDDSQLILSNCNFYCINGVVADGDCTLGVISTEINATQRTVHVTNGETCFTNSWLEGGGSTYPVYFSGGESHLLEGTHYGAYIETAPGTPLRINGGNKQLMVGTDAEHPFLNHFHKAYAYGHADVVEANGVASQSDSDAMTGTAWRSASQYDGIRVYWVTSSRDLLPRGSYLVTVYAKDTNAVAGDLAIESYTYTAGGSPVKQFEANFTLTSEYKAYSVIHVIDETIADTNRRGSTVWATKNTATANTLDISHVEVRWLGADLPFNQNLIAYSHDNTDGDGARESKVQHIGRQSGDEQSVLAETIARHEGSSDDQKGEYVIATNGGSDNGNPTEAVKWGSDQITNFMGTMGNSAKDPTADAPADWIEVQIDGTTYYLPAYAAS